MKWGGGGGDGHQIGFQVDQEISSLLGSRSLQSRERGKVSRPYNALLCLYSVE